MTMPGDEQLGRFRLELVPDEADLPGLRRPEGVDVYTGQLTASQWIGNWRKRNEGAQESEMGGSRR